MANPFPLGRWISWLLPRWIIPLLFAFLATASAQSSGSGRVEKVPLLFRRLIVPRIEFQEATAAEAFQFLERKARDTVQEPPVHTPGFQIDPAMLPDVRITVSLTNVSLEEALRTTAALAGVRLVFTADSVSIHSHSSGLLPQFGSRIDSVSLSEKQRALLARAARLIVPRLEFREATIPEAADFLRRKAAEIGDEPNPATRGLNMIILPAFDRDKVDRVTMSTTDTSLLEILKTIARLSSGELRVSDAGFVLDVAGPRPATRERTKRSEREPVPPAIPGL